MLNWLSCHYEISFLISGNTFCLKVYYVWYFLLANVYTVCVFPSLYFEHLYVIYKMSLLNHMQLGFVFFSGCFCVLEYFVSLLLLQLLI